MARDPQPPVIARPELLPLNDPSFPWKSFQAFCRGLVGFLPGFTSCSEYGVDGNRQDGIDLIAVREDGSEWGLQCKQYQKYMKSQAEVAIVDAVYPAQQFRLLLTCEATKGVQDAVRAHDGWDVWDLRDLSDKVRQLPSHQARTLVETYFGPYWRRAFLGLYGLVAFQTPEDFFADLCHEDRLFHHTWELVGRREVLERLHGLVREDGPTVAVLPGRGGIGKSRVLKEFATESLSRHPGWNVLFTADGVALTSDAVDELPTGSAVIILDDAHRRQDLELLLAVVRQRRQKKEPTLLLLSTRPSGVDRLEATFSRLNISSETVLGLPELRELTGEQVRELARQVLGPHLERYAEMLTQATRDCPLITVIGGRLLAQRSVPPALLERHDDFRRAALSRFQDEILGHIGDRVDPQLTRQLLELLAAIGPFDPARDDIRAAVAEYLTCDVTEVVRAIDGLEGAGVLLRRGQTTRIVPDVLADHLLHEACVTRRGESTGYVDQVFQRFGSLCAESLLRNLGELDWRIRVGQGEGLDLLKRFWAEVRAEFQAASNEGRVRRLELLRDFGLYRPGDMIELVEWAIRNPARAADGEERRRFRDGNHDDVLWVLPSILRRIALSPHHTTHALDLLWELGRDDPRPQNRQERAICVLEELAAFDPNIPIESIEMQTRIVEAVERWLSAPGVHHHLHSLLRVIDPVLRKTGTSHYDQGMRIIIKPFFLLPEPTRAVRERALSLVGGCARSLDLRVALRALDSLKIALAYPDQPCGVAPSDEYIASWVPEQIRVVDLLEQAAQAASHPLIPLKVLEIVARHLALGFSAQLQQRVRRLVAALPSGSHLCLVRELAYGCDPGAKPSRRHRRREERARFEKKRKQTVALVASEFRESHATAVEAVEVLEAELERIRSAGVEPNAWYFLTQLASQDLPFALEMSRLVARRPASALAWFLFALLGPVHRLDPAAARQIVAGVIEDGNPDLCRSIARLLGWEGWSEDMTTTDKHLGERLVQHPDPTVRRHALGALARGRRGNPEGVLNLAFATRVDGNGHVAEALCELFHPELGVQADQLAPGVVSSLLEKLEDVDDLGEWAIESFLRQVAKTNGRAVVSFLIQKIERGRFISSRHQALELALFDKNGDLVLEPVLVEELLRMVRDRVLSPEWWVSSELSKLFVRLAPRLPELSLHVLKEWVEAGVEERLVSVARILGQADEEFVFRESEFAAHMLDRAADITPECEQLVASELARSALTRTGFRQRGEPSPHNLALRDRAMQVGQLFPDGSRARRFYDGLVSYGQALIREDLKEDEDDLD